MSGADAADDDGVVVEKKIGCTWVCLKGEACFKRKMRKR
jgi:hypothetical protein